MPQPTRESQVGCGTDFVDACFRSLALDLCALPWGLLDGRAISVWLCAQQHIAWDLLGEQIPDGRQRRESSAYGWAKALATTVTEIASCDDTDDAIPLLT